MLPPGCPVAAGQIPAGGHNEKDIPSKRAFLRMGQSLLGGMVFPAVVAVINPPAVEQVLSIVADDAVIYAAVGKKLWKKNSIRGVMTCNFFESSGP